MEKMIIIAPTGEDLDSLFTGIKNFPTEKIILITDDNNKHLALKAKEEIEKFKNCCSSLEELSQTTKMSLPLVSYYINGNVNTEGLESMGLVDVEKVKGKIHISLSTLGRMLVKGYVPLGVEKIKSRAD